MKSLAVSFEASLVSGLISLRCFAVFPILVPETARVLQTGDSLSIDGLVLTPYCEISSLLSLRLAFPSLSPDAD